MTQPTPPINKKKSHWKLKMIIVLMMIFLAAGVYGYYWYTSTLNLRQTYQQVISQAQQYEEVKNIITAEYNRCQAFIAEGAGNFGNFEYCQSFIEWVKTQASSVLSN